MPTSRTVNSKALSSNISLTASDVGAVPTSRTVNSKALSSNISLTASDVGAVALSGSKATPAQISADVLSVTGNRTLALTDAGKFLYVNSTSNLTMTIPTNSSVAFPVGTEIEFCRWNTGTVTFAAASGVALVAANSMKKISDRYATAGIKQVAANTWVLTGSLA